MSLRLDRFPLSPVETSAVDALPDESRQGDHFLLQRVIRRDSHFSRTIDLRHFPQKYEAMIGSPSQDIELPLVDHFMCQSVDQFLLQLRRARGQLLKEWT